MHFFLNLPRVEYLLNRVRDYCAGFMLWPILNEVGRDRPSRIRVRSSTRAEKLQKMLIYYRETTGGVHEYLSEPGLWMRRWNAVQNDGVIGL